MRTPEKIRQTAENKYREFLLEHLSGRTVFPWEIAFGRPKGGRNLDLTAEASRALVDGSALKVGFGYTVETAEVGTRYGQQRLPVRVYFPDFTQFLQFIGKKAEVARIEAEVALIAALVPAAEAWARTHPFEVLARSGRWQELCSIVEYLIAHPQPKCYPRELPLNVSGKLLGDEQAVLCDLLRSIPGPHWIEGPDYFTQLGLLRPPASFIRFRFLDDSVRVANGYPVSEVALSAEILAACPLEASRLFIVENLMTYLAFPSVPGGVLFFGEGNAASRLTQLRWMGNRSVVYWGDLDPYGFTILGRLRILFPAVRSMLMDETIRQKYDHLGAPGERPEPWAFTNLNDAERAVAEELYQRQWSLEQEKIPQWEVAAFITKS